MTNQNSFTTKVDALNYMMRSTNTSPTELQLKTEEVGYKVNRGQAYRWINKEVSKPRLETYNAVCEALGFNSEVKNGQIVIQKSTPQTQRGKQPMHTQAYENQIEINQLLREKIGFLEEKLANPARVTTKTIITTSLWDQVDYDVQTFQTYDKEDLGYFKTYKIIKWQEFFAKLGYVGQEAIAAYEKHRNSVYLTNRNKDKSEFFYIQKKTTDPELYNRNVSRDFFKNEFAQQTVSKMTRFNINYLHKNGSFVPAILHSLFDFDNLTGVSKIKFIETNT